MQDVSGHKDAGGNFGQFAVTHHPNNGYGHPLERSDGSFGAIFLNKTENGKQDDNGKDGDRVFCITDGGGDDGGDDENQHHRGGKLFPENLKRRPSPFFDEFVVTVLGEAGLGLLAAQTVSLRRLKRSQRGFRFHRIPVHSRTTSLCGKTEKGFFNTTTQGTKTQRHKEK